MLISKWAVLRALVDYNPILAVFVVFGSCITVFFWVKWIGKLITVIETRQHIEKGISISEWMSLFILSFLTVGICFFLPQIAEILIRPYIIEAYNKTIHISHDNVVIMALMLGMVMLFPLSFIHHGRKVKVAGPYLSGANVGNHESRYHGFGSEIKNMQLGNYYLERYLPEQKLLRLADLLCLCLILGIFILLWIVRRFLAL
jgi:ech hydrogenase subunit A